MFVFSINNRKLPWYQEFFYISSGFQSDFLNKHSEIGNKTKNRLVLDRETLVANRRQLSIHMSSKFSSSIPLRKKSFSIFLRAVYFCECIVFSLMKQFFAKIGDNFCFFNHQIHKCTACLEVHDELACHCVWIPTVKIQTCNVHG